MRGCCSYPLLTFVSICPIARSLKEPPPASPVPSNKDAALSSTGSPPSYRSTSSSDGYDKHRNKSHPFSDMGYGSTNSVSSDSSSGDSESSRVLLGVTNVTSLAHLSARPRTQARTYPRTYPRTYELTHVTKDLTTHVCTYGCTHVPTHVPMQVCTYGCTHVNKYLTTYVCTYGCTHVPMQVCTYGRTHVPTHVWMHARTHTRDDARTHTRMHAWLSLTHPSLNHTHPCTSPSPPPPPSLLYSARFSWEPCYQIVPLFVSYPPPPPPPPPLSPQCHQIVCRTTSRWSQPHRTSGIVGLQGPQWLSFSLWRTGNSLIHSMSHSLAHPLPHWHTDRFID